MCEPVNGPVTHALVIGVSRYRHLADGDDPRGWETFGLGQIDCAATGAFQFACWLRDHYRNNDAPLCSIRLLLSPSQHELANEPGLKQAAAEVPPATHGEVKKATKAWRDNCKTNAESVAFFYASGHGIREADLIPAVLLEDFAAEERSMDYSLDVQDVWEEMQVAIGTTQVYFVDACAIDPIASQRWKTLGNGAFFAGSRDIVESRLTAPIFQSAVNGTEAFGDQGRGTLFSRALHRCLEGEAAEQVGDEYKITVIGLLKALPNAVRQEGLASGRLQEIEPTGRMKDAALCELDGPPSVKMVVRLEPEEARPNVDGSIRDENGDLFEEGIFKSAKVFEKSVPMGQYNLKAEIAIPSPRYQTRSKLVVARPPLGVNQLLDVRR